VFRGFCGLRRGRRTLHGGRTVPDVARSRVREHASRLEETPFQWDLLEGAKGVQLAELGLKSWAERRWVDVPALEASR
jgi:hypothetical protein